MNWPARTLHAFGFRPLEDCAMLRVKPVHDVAEMKGLRVRSYGFAYPALIEARGAAQASIATSEAWEAPKRNIIDGARVGPAPAPRLEIRKRGEILHRDADRRLLWAPAGDEPRQPYRVGRERPGGGRPTRPRLSGEIRRDAG
jgi:hypothetical protein